MEDGGRGDVVGSGEHLSSEVSRKSKIKQPTLSVLLAGNAGGFTKLLHTESNARPVGRAYVEDCSIYQSTLLAR